jgi:hypothetical protein
MGIKLTLFILVLSLSFGLSRQALALDSDRLPMIPGSKEKPCGEDETGTCLETPKKRFELTTSADIGSVVKELLRLTKTGSDWHNAENSPAVLKTNWPKRKK